MKNVSPMRSGWLGPAGRLAIRVASTLAVVIAVGLNGCEADTPTVSDSNTNWLMECDNNAQCTGGLTCLCGICTETCTSSDSCVAAGEGARCVSTETGVAADRCAERGHDDAAMICAITCETTSTCVASEQMCVENLCQEPAVSPMDAADDAPRADTGAGDARVDTGATDAGVDGATDANVPDALGSDAGDAAMVTCAPGLCLNGGRCASDGMTCECPPGITGATCDQVANVRQLVVGLHHSCVLLGSSAIKCWGDNEAGQLGQGDVSARGDAPNELGTNLLPIDLGSAAAVHSISAGTAHTCALLVNGSVKCWGFNGEGQLGLGDTDNRGDAPGEMGTMLPFVSLGVLVAREISAGGSHTCARFDDGRVACWGGNLNGELGIDSVLARGVSANELGANMLFAQLGVGAVAKQVVASSGYSCALLEGDGVKCWGRNINGQLGVGDTDNRGDQLGEMALLNPIALGDVTSGVVAIDTHGAHACARLGSGALRCWGFGGAGELGLGDTLTLGDQPNEMGANLPDAQIGGSVVQVSAGTAQTCAVLTGNVLKCWGQNNAGQLGLGDVLTWADEATEINAMLPAVMLPVGVITSVATGGFHTCVLIDGSDVYCVGENALGELGRGNTDRVGDDAAEVPIAPPPVSL